MIVKVVDKYLINKNHFAYICTPFPAHEFFSKDIFR
jgi:hypothetical protein